MLKELRSALPTPTTSGFTLLEVVVVISIMSTLAAMTMPFVQGMLLSQRLEKVRSELTAIGRALNTYWTENESFPASLTATTFLNTHLMAGVDSDAVTDDFATNANYQVSIAAGPPVVWTIYSVGPNGEDDSAADDDIAIVVSSARPGNLLTIKKMQYLAWGVTHYLKAYNWVSTSDVWSLDTYNGASGLGAQLGLPSYFDTDGFGNYWYVHATNVLIRSKGSDGADDSGSDDDINW